MQKFLDDTGLAYFWDKVKARIDETHGGAIPSLPVKALTTAEYNTLSEEEKMADVVYIITDDSGSVGGSSEEIYSTEETRIGTWIDGRPIYRKVVESNVSVPPNTTAILCTIDHLGTLIHAYGHGKASNSWYMPINNYIGSLLYKENGEIHITGNNQTTATRFISNSWVILEYTKTTDEAKIKMPVTALFPQEILKEMAETPGLDFGIAPTASDIQEVI